MDLQAILDDAAKRLADITRAARADDVALRQITEELRAAEAKYEREEAAMEHELAELSRKTTDAFLAYAKAVEGK